MTYPLEDLADFAREHVRSGDIDPAYPVLRQLQRTFGEERALWHSLVYVAYYNLASAEEAFERELDDWLWGQDRLISEDVVRLPTGTERRGLRGGKAMRLHLSTLVRERRRAGGSFVNWLVYPTLDVTPEKAWELLDVELQKPYGNARWASYKTREVLMKVNGLRLAPTDTGMANSTGPRDGLALIWPKAAELRGNDEATIAALEEAAWYFRDGLESSYGVDLGIEQFETVLCDFHAMADGRYYVGHDIDLMLEQIESERVPEAVRARILEARRNVFPEEYLAELNGGLRRADMNRRKRYYAEKGALLFR